MSTLLRVGTAVLALASACQQHPMAINPAFDDVTAESGLAEMTPTFGAVFTDIDNDDDDDLLVSRHGGGPALYLQTEPMTFVEAAGVLPSIRGDLHGITLVDLDNDGDKDIVVACGGDDGIGPGCLARVFDNRLIQDQRLSFVDVSSASGLAVMAAHRSRSYLPSASEDGSRIDLYLTGKARDEAPNRFYRNVGHDAIEFTHDESSSLGQSFDSEGRDVFFDYDRDGDQDLLLVNNGQILLLQRISEDFVPVVTSLSRPRRVSSVAVGDVDNDGFPDVFLGTFPVYGRSDRLSYNLNRIHFYMTQQNADVQDAIRFKTEGKRVLIDFVVKPGLADNDPSTIFLGAKKSHPVRRRARVAASRAEGAPRIDAPGTYIWYERETDEWNVVWHYEGTQLTVERGLIAGKGISDVRRLNTEIVEDGEAEDILFSNEGGRTFAPLEGARWPHPHSTVAARLVDLNNDGFLDVVGLRANSPGGYNGEPFVLVNEGGSDFRKAGPTGLESTDDDLFAADQLVPGFADADGRVDIFVTHGGGLNPGNQGPYQLFENVTETRHHYVLLRLIGSGSNRDAIGAQVELLNESGSIIGYREVGAGYHRSQPSAQIHFGLGAFGGPAVARVLWPSGRVSQHQLEVDAVTHISEPNEATGESRPTTSASEDRTPP